MSMQPEGQSFDPQGSWCGGGGGEGQGRPPWWWLYPPPWWPGPGGGTGGGTGGGQNGVTDGSVAQPGQIGEVVRFDQTVEITQTGSWAQPLSAGVLQPGDWDVQASCTFRLLLQGGDLILDPKPAGMIDDMATWGSVTEAGGDVGLQLVTLRVQANFTQPTLMAFRLGMWSVIDGTIGSWTTRNIQFILVARRMR